MIKMPDFKNYIGKHVPFYGAINNQFKTGNDLVFEARPHHLSDTATELEKVEYRSNSDEKFYCKPFTVVFIEEIKSKSFEGYVLKDFKTGHPLLTFGTSLKTFYQEPVNEYYWLYQPVKGC